jgi:hypothetical protein
MDINLIKDKNSYEATNIVLTAKPEQNNNLDLLRKITFTNKK